MAGYAAYDMASAIIVITFAVLGLTGGFLRQITRLIAIVLGGWAAIQYGPDFIHRLGSIFGQGSAVIIPLLMFLTVYLTVVIVGHLLLKLLRATSPAAGLIDRLMGLALGVLKGAIMVYILTAILLYAAGTTRIRGLGTKGSIVYAWVREHPVTRHQVERVKDQVKFKVIHLVKETKKVLHGEDSGKKDAETRREDAGHGQSSKNEKGDK